MPKGSTVLMADDDKTLLDMYRERLDLAGYNVVVAHNGEEAIIKVKETNPDIILLDVMMPKANGYEVLEAIKSEPQTKDIPVIMLSALMRDLNREKAVSAGADDYLIKSEAMPSDIITKVEQVLQKTKKPVLPATTPATPVPAANDQLVVKSQPEEATAETVPSVPVTPETKISVPEPPKPATPAVEAPNNSVNQESAPVASTLEIKTSVDEVPVIKLEKPIQNPEQEKKEVKNEEQKLATPVTAAPSPVYINEPVEKTPPANYTFWYVVTILFIIIISILLYLLWSK